VSIARWNPKGPEEKYRAVINGGHPKDEPQSSSSVAHCSLAYSALACLRMGMSGSASFQRVRKSW
jgi:hypothetical protein